MAGAAGVMGAAAWASATGLERAFGHGGLALNLLTGLVPVVVGMAVYALLTRWLGVGEAETLWALVRAPRGRPRAPQG